MLHSLHKYVRNLPWRSAAFQILGIKKRIGPRKGYKNHQERTWAVLPPTSSLLRYPASLARPVFELVALFPAGCLLAPGDCHRSHLGGALYTPVQRFSASEQVGFLFQRVPPHCGFASSWGFFYTPLNTPSLLRYNLLYS